MTGTLKIQGKDVFSYVKTESGIVPNLVRTYKGEVARTQAGVVSAFPASFITPGFDFSFQGTREQIKALEKILLSANTFELIVIFKEINIKGMFSCTKNQVTEVNDRDLRHLQLAVSVVAVGTPITKSDGNYFTVKYNNTTVLNNGTYGKAFALPTAYSSKKIDGYALPQINSKPYLLIVKDEVLED